MGLTISFPLFGLVVILLVRLVVGRGLSQVNRLSNVASTIDAASLDVRMPTSGQPRELEALSLQLNTLLDRLEESFDRERRMTAGLAHELRTPVAELLSTAEVAKLWRDDPEAIHAIVDVSQDVARRMKNIIEGLLHLARIETGEHQLENEPISLSEKIDDSWKSMARVAKERGTTIEASGREKSLKSIDADKDLLRVVVNNLVSNAILHSPEASTIRSKIVQDGTTTQWCLSNPCGELTPADLSRLAEPFWCLDRSRTHLQNVGLGLALVQRVIKLMGGSVEYSIRHDQFTVSLTLT